ncbi:hypothetical protein Ais01nite_01180 [Asanoa ishikariensis]|uniref:TIR domain-containing protein n=1 Tax=Asanoa ishikariensis TaxID=137265 RepID=A0A1H3TN92_9ACTN|nr:toll/interleukin-1 receptor domain-containing protein [Asanoa ishikariensis]GIF62083.1 hypothetical protein Ais01nite_01180 [Asanoa ishikariensis]SDZ51763.1 TIR domain-containing protein [Asanoa ishikariensis]
MRFFISHSARTEQAKAVLRQLRVRLRAAGHTVFVDADVLAGLQWRSVLYHELAICDAAVVLLDQTSLSRRWVQREADVLLWRRAFDERLTIVPVLLDDTKIDTVRGSGFGEFTEAQFLLADGLGPATVAERVADRFAASERPDPPDLPGTRMRQWFDDIETVLTRIGHQNKLRLAALELGVSPQDADQVLLGVAGGYRFLAHQFLARSVDTAAVDAMSRILYCADTDTLRKLAGLIAPTWVDHSAALPLKLAGPTPRTVAVLNARDFRTALHYVQRATCLDRRVRVEQVSGVVGEDSAGDLFAQCETAVLRLVGAEPPFDTLADVPPQELRDGPPEPAYLIVSTASLPTRAVTDVIDDIRARYPWLVVVVLVGTEPPGPETLARWGLADAKVLAPTLDPGEEFRAHRTVRSLYRMIDSSLEEGPYGD